MLHLKSETKDRWLRQVDAHLDLILIDHAHCEKKAAGTALNLLFAYVDDVELCREMTLIVNEELEHFHIMFRLISARDLQLPDDEKDLYVGALRGQMTQGDADALFLDRLLVPGIVEARGCERLRLVTDALDEGPLKQTYQEVTRAEARHHALFFRLARRYFDAGRVAQRAAELLEVEGRIVSELPLRPAVH